jgi:uncharacterized protein (TIGR00369 family)
MNSTRTRAIEWQDPLAAAAAALQMDGLDAVRAIASGDLPLPPIAELMGFELIGAEPGWVAASVDPREFHYNGTGCAQGSLVAALLDCVLNLAVQTTLHAGHLATRLEMTVNFVRPITVATGRLIGEGGVVHRDETVVTTQGRIEDSRSRLVAHATATALIRPSES